MVLEWGFVFLHLLEKFSDSSNRLMLSGFDVFWILIPCPHFFKVVGVFLSGIAVI